MVFRFVMLINWLSNRHSNSKFTRKSHSVTHKKLCVRVACNLLHHCPTKLTTQVLEGLGHVYAIETKGNIVNCTLASIENLSMLPRHWLGDVGHSHDSLFLTQDKFKNGLLTWLPSGGGLNNPLPFTEEYEKDCQKSIEGRLTHEIIIGSRFGFVTLVFLRLTYSSSSNSQSSSCEGRKRLIEGGNRKPLTFFASLCVVWLRNNIKFAVSFCLCLTKLLLLFYIALSPVCKWIETTTTTKSTVKRNNIYSFWRKPRNVQLCVAFCQNCYCAAFLTTHQSGIVCG